MIVFQYFRDCPGTKETLANLLQAKEERHIKDSDLSIVEVQDASMAGKLHFQGSPTILIDGVDIYTDEQPGLSNYSCRIYEFNGKRTNVIPEEFIKEKLILSSRY